jgi:signal transduction histidine kinase
MTGMESTKLDAEALLTGAYDYIDKLALTRDLVDRAIRFAIKSHQYERRLREAVAEAKEQASINSNILSIVSHEMKSPISSIVGYCDFLIKKAASDTTKDAAVKMKAASVHLEDFLRNLSEFVRLDNGGAKIAIAEFDIAKMLDETVAFFQPYAQHKGIALVLECNESISDTFAGDRLRIRQVLINLLKNAVTYSDGGVIQVVATIENDLLRVTITDQGVGMAESKVAAILSDEIAPQAPGQALDGGLGLGLSIVRRLLLLMKGRFTLESAEGFGTSVAFEIPLERRASIEAA